MLVDLEKHEILKGRVRMCKSSYSEIARQMNVTAAYVTMVSQGHRSSHKIQNAIADCLSTTPLVLFPDRYIELEKI